MCCSLANPLVGWPGGCFRGAWLLWVVLCESLPIVDRPMRNNLLVSRAASRDFTKYSTLRSSCLGLRGSPSIPLYALLVLGVKGITKYSTLRSSCLGLRGSPSIPLYALLVLGFRGSPSIPLYALLVLGLRGSPSIPLYALLVTLAL
jgi:hypothetical protein